LNSKIQPRKLPYNHTQWKENATAVMEIEGILKPSKSKEMNDERPCPAYAIQFKQRCTKLVGSEEGEAESKEY
jgi:hypothetical protein